VLKVLAVDGVDDAVGADELDSAVNVDIYHCATLTVLEEGGSVHARPLQYTPAQIAPGEPPPELGSSRRNRVHGAGSSSQMAALRPRLGVGIWELTVERMCRTTSRGTTERSSNFSCKRKHR
jgi:hypothetical protein